MDWRAVARAFSKGSAISIGKVKDTSVLQNSENVAKYTLLLFILAPILGAILCWILKWRPDSKCDLNDYNPVFDDHITGVIIPMNEKNMNTVTGLMNVRDTAKVTSGIQDAVAVQEQPSAVVGLNSDKAQRNSSSSNSASKNAVILKEPYIFQASGLGHALSHAKRPFIHPEILLIKLVQHGPYFFPFTTIELMEILEEAGNRFSQDESLLDIPAGVTVIGDIRGRYIDLHRWLQLTGWPPKNTILFLGGLIDSSEPGSIECLALVCALKVVFPNNVFYLRGAPEALPYWPEGRYRTRIARAIASRTARLFSNLPFAAIIGESIFASYGGCSSMTQDKDHIRRQFRPQPNEQLTQLQKQLIFNQPSSLVRMYRPNLDSRGDLFGSQAVRTFCSSFNMYCIIRAQSPVKNGFMSVWKNRMFSVWSAPGLKTDYGAVLYVSTTLVVQPLFIKKQP